VVVVGALDLLVEDDEGDGTVGEGIKWEWDEGGDDLK